MSAYLQTEVRPLELESKGKHACNGPSTAMPHQVEGTRGPGMCHSCHSSVKDALIGTLQSPNSFTGRLARSSQTLLSARHGAHATRQSNGL